MTTPSPVELGCVQRWMQRVIVDPRGAAAGVAAAGELEPALELAEVCTGSPSLSAVERLSIYNRGYFSRLAGCLEATMPALRASLGEELFHRFAVDYVSARPSRSYTLGALSGGFVDFLRETRPDRDLPADAREAWVDFVVELATLEHDLWEVFDGPGQEGRWTAPPGLAALDERRFAAIRLTPSPSLRLRRFGFPVHRVVRAVRGGREAPFPRPEATFLALYRRDYRVHVAELSALDHALLAAIAEGAAVGEAAARTGVDVPRERLERWAESGFFESSNDRSGP